MWVWYWMDRQMGECRMALLKSEHGGLLFYIATPEPSDCCMMVPGTYAQMAADYS